MGFNVLFLGICSRVEREREKRRGVDNPSERTQSREDTLTCDCEKRGRCRHGSVRMSPCMRTDDDASLSRLTREPWPTGRARAHEP